MEVEVFTKDLTCNDLQNLNPDKWAIANVTGDTSPINYQWLEGIGVDIKIVPSGFRSFPK